MTQYEVLQHNHQYDYRIYSSEIEKLSVESILDTLDDFKNNLVYKLDENNELESILEIHCYMTEKIKRNLIIAYKRLKSYGKTFIPSLNFNKFGCLLPTEIHSNCNKKVTIHIIEGDSPYLELKFITIVSQQSNCFSYDDEFLIKSTT